MVSERNMTCLFKKKEETMKFKVEINEFAGCMRKIQPAVSMAKEKNGVKEGMIYFNILSQQAAKENCLGIAVAFDGKKQLLSAFRVEELEMEEESFNFYLSGKRIYDISQVFASAKGEYLSISIDKTCLIEKGGSHIKIPLGEKPPILQTNEKFLLHATMKTSQLIDAITKGGRFYTTALEDVVSSVCIKYDITEQKMILSSSDTYKIAYCEKKVSYEVNGKEQKQKEIIHLIEGDELKLLTKFLECEDTDCYIYPNCLYLKSGTDVALILTLEADNEYPLDAIQTMYDNHSKENKLEVTADEMIEALNVFDAVNQENQPYVHIIREESGLLSFQTKGKTGKTTVNTIVGEEFKEVVLNSKMLRQVINNYEKNKKITLYIGKPDEPVLLKQKEASNDFAILIKINAD